MGSVTDKQLTAVAMRDQGFTYKAIGEAMGISGPAARYLLRRAYRAMEREFVKVLVGGA
jgi:DNA-directed RNA polymerase specialized sigma24 family protein